MNKPSLHAMNRLPDRKMQNAFFCLAISLFLLAGCGSPTFSAGEISETYKTPFRPPTLVVKLTPSQTPTVPSQKITPTLQCTNNLKFLSDLTIPDGTAVEPNATMDKRWEVENNGTCNWGDGYRLKFISGAKLNAQPEQALFPARSGSRAEVRILFQAPTEAGKYNSAWQAIDPQGNAFGDPIFIDIVVKK